MLELSASLAELAAFSFKYHILHESALQCAIEQGDFFRRGETYLCKILVTVAYYPCVIALKNVLELASEQSIESFHVGYIDAFAIRGIGDDHSAFGCIVPLCEAFCLYIDVFLYACAAYVALGDRDGCG